MKIACVGDSITYGSGVRLTRGWNSYPSILSRLMGRKYKVYNFGNPGRTLASIGDFPYILEAEYRNSQELMADVYIIMLGTNDSKPYNWNEEVFKKEYPEFVNSYRELFNKPKVFLMIPPKAFSVEWEKNKVPYDIQNDIIRDFVYKIVKECGNEEKLPVIDLYTLTEDSPQWFVDGVHPNRRGNKAIAKEIYRCITKNMETQD